MEPIGRLFELFSAPQMDWEAVYELADPDIVWEVRSDFPDAAVCRGHEGLRRWSESFDAVLEETWYRPLEFIPTGDHVVVPLRWGGRGKGGGAPFAEHEETWVFTLRGGRIAHVREFATRAEAIAAVGGGQIG